MRRAHQRRKRTPQKRYPFSWSEWGDSNSRHPAPKAGALPTALHPVIELILCSVEKHSGCRPALSAHRRVSRFPSAVRTRQSGHFLESASLHLPQAALRRFPQSRRATNCATPGYLVNGFAAFVSVQRPALDKAARFLLRFPKKTSRLRFARFFRPRPLARLPFSATGGGRLAPQLRYTR